MPEQLAETDFNWHDGVLVDLQFVDFGGERPIQFPSTSILILIRRPSGGVIGAPARARPDSS
jgi:hypothetical protein